jgi:hypothetical protein
MEMECKHQLDLKTLICFTMFSYCLFLYYMCFHFKYHTVHARPCPQRQIFKKCVLRDEMYRKRESCHEATNSFRQEHRHITHKALQLRDAYATTHTLQLHSAISNLICHYGIMYAVYYCCC